MDDKGFLELVIFLLKSGWSAAALLAVIMIYLVFHPDKVGHWAALLYKAALSMSATYPALRNRLDRRTVKYSLQDIINVGCEKINREAPETFPNTVKIEWKTTGTPEHIIKDGRAILRLRHYPRQEENIVKVTLYYLAVGFLPVGKNYLDESLRRASEYRIATQIFATSKDTNALGYFIEHELTPSFDTYRTLRTDIGLLEHIDSRGFFTHVFLREVREASIKMLGTLPTRDMQNELRAFAGFLYTIATKDPGEDVPLTFDGLKVRVAVVLVAKADIIDTLGVDPYINRIQRCVRQGCQYIYLAAWGTKYVSRVIEIKHRMHRLHGAAVTVLHQYSLRSYGGAGILLVCQSNASFVARQYELEQEVTDAIKDIVPEVKSGEIHIVSIARIPGAGCKIAVRPASSESTPSQAVGLCVGSGGQRAQKLSERLGKGKVYFLAWSEKPGELIVNALAPLPPGLIESVSVDEENLIASVAVTNKYARTNALGPDNINLHLASLLTNFHITIEDLSARKHIPTPTPDPHKQLEEILRKTILEIQHNELQIVNIARIPRYGAKVVTRWRYDKLGKRPSSSWICRQQYETITEQLGGERIVFHDWKADDKELIKECLYPLRDHEIEDIELNHDTKVATIRLCKIVKAPATWRSRVNLQLAHDVTGWILTFIQTE